MSVRIEYVYGTIALLLCTISGSAIAGPVRRWTDAAGQRHVDAELVGIEGEKAQLKRTDNGVVVTIATKALSAGDARFIQHWSDLTKRTALEKFEEIGDVSCDADGSIHLGLSQSGCTDNNLKFARLLDINGPLVRMPYHR